MAQDKQALDAAAELNKLVAPAPIINGDDNLQELVNEAMDGLNTNQNPYRIGSRATLEGPATSSQNMSDQSIQLNDFISKQLDSLRQDPSNVDIGVAPEQRFRPNPNRDVLDRLDPSQTAQIDDRRNTNGRASRTGLNK